MAQTVYVVDKGHRKAIRAIRALDRLEVTIGLHEPEKPRREAGGEIDNVGLGVVHEFGATIQHPGGTPYMVNWQAAGRGGGFVGGNIVFLRKGDPKAIGLTRPHPIRIPERAFMRTAFDKNVVKYERAMLREAKKSIRGTQSPTQAIGRVGEIALADIVNGINRGLPPPLKAATIRRKRGKSKPLIDTGQLKQALKAKVGKAKR